MNLLIKIALFAGITRATVWYGCLYNSTQQQAKYSPSVSYYLGQFSINSLGSSSLKVISRPETLSTQSIDVAFDPQQGHLYYVTTEQPDFSAQNMTKTIRRLVVDQDRFEVLFQLSGASGVQPRIDNMALDSIKQAIYFTYTMSSQTEAGFFSITLFWRYDISSNTTTNFFNLTQVSESTTPLLSIDEVTSKLYFGHSRMGLKVFDLNRLGEPPVNVSDSAPTYGFIIDHNRQMMLYINQANNLIIERPLSSLDGSFTNTTRTNNDATIYSLYGYNPGDLISFGDFPGFYITKSSDAMVVRVMNLLYTIPYPNDGSYLTKLVFNGTDVVSNMTMIVNLVHAPAKMDTSIEGYSYAINAFVITVMVIGVAAGAFSSISAGGAGTDPTAVTSSASLTNLIWVLITQLQFMVVLTQLSGPMPSIYTQFIANISWVMLSFKGATFGITSRVSVKDGMNQFAAALGMGPNAAFGSIMIVLIIIYSILFLLALLARKFTATYPALKGIDEKLSKLAGHLFLLAYLNMTTLSAYNVIYLPDGVSGAFGGIVLMFVCTAFVFYVFTGLRFPTHLHDSVIAVFNNIFKGPLCGKYQPRFVIFGFASLSFKYIKGLIIGALQFDAVAQSTLLFLLNLFEFGVVANIRPHVVAELCYLDLAGMLIQVISAIVKLRLASIGNPDEPASAQTILILNGIFLFSTVVRIMFSAVRQAREKRKLKDGSKPVQVQQSNPV